ncbi:molybdopterin molybdenumtransferase [Bacillus sp. AFS002410]|uniref:molybdopterin molybdotransferase MoeA n=1 Tax=Bacillus sp. AFS002410 TaxID=2033481 RepID=UPI000BF1AF19|nr:gephyrin-like molybdotransferase Glp [Bacillus sp. AFS002410]PEJ59342.1 molybdopterin molybdenumtransferase [Bacillus sp. AFS002410]
MVEKRIPLPVAEAVRKVMEFAVNGSQEMVSIDLAYGRVLADDVKADQDIPAFDRSPYDGFAIRAEDTIHTTNENPTVFEVVGEIGAGSVFPNKVEPFQAVRIMTGAQIPQGCSAVVMLELVKEMKTEDKSFIEIKRSFPKGDNISFQGEETSKGDILVKKGTEINPGTIALLATFGYSEVPVAKKPVIGVIATGSELLDVNEPLEPGKIRNSNSYMVLAQIQKSGGIPKYLGKFSDDLDTCFSEVKNALEQVDILITTGGVSVGDYDYLPDIYARLGATVLFNKIAMRPGSVTTVAHYENKLLFGLSGNPSACFVGFELFVRPIIQTYLFNETPHLKRVSAVLGENYPKPNPFTRFVRGKVVYDEVGLTAIPAGFDKSSAVSSLANTDAFIVLPGGTRKYEKGMAVDLLLLEDPQGSKWPWHDFIPSYK